MMKAEVIITVDHELPAGGRGDVRQKMIQPLGRLLDICEAAGAPLTVMAEMGEVWAFEDPENEPGFDRHLGYRAAAEIRAQLAQAVRRGHDVQLHLHPQWLGARWTREGQWRLDYEHYQLTSLDFAAMVAALRRGREDLEALLRPQNPDYACLGFRAGHWNTFPNEPYLAALAAAGLRSDTSVFKGGYAHRHSVRFDYRSAQSHFRAWRACPFDINRADPAGVILEVPIAAMEAGWLKLLTLKRLRLALGYLREDRLVERGVNGSLKAGAGDAPGGLWRKLGRLLGRRPMKLDFCKLTARQMEALVAGLLDQAGREEAGGPVPIVMIGHTKQAGGGADLGRFLRRMRTRFDDRLDFGTYRGFIRKMIDRETIRESWAPGEAGVA